jgi:hypothetical protein
MSSGLAWKTLPSLERRNCLETNGRKCIDYFFLNALEGIKNNLFGCRSKLLPGRYFSESECKRIVMRFDEIIIQVQKICEKPLELEHWAESRCDRASSFGQIPKAPTHEFTGITPSKIIIAFSLLIRF